MARDWEKTLTSWGKPASQSEEDKRDRTEKAIRKALDADPGVKDLGLKVYAKGSYANNTNVQGDSDVDINVEYHRTIYYNLDFDLKGKKGSDYGWESSGDEHPSPTELRRLVEAALVRAFGQGAVKGKDKAIKLSEEANRLEADVVPCYEYHRYSRLDAGGRPKALVGTKLFPVGGGSIINWPQQHHDNGVSKNVSTGGRFKKMVRCLKNLENEMVEKGEAKQVPSYLIECLVWNVPSGKFGNETLYKDLRAVLAVIFNQTQSEQECNDWAEVNDLKYLFRGRRDWTWEQAHELADSAWDYVGFPS